MAQLNALLSSVLFSPGRRRGADSTALRLVRRQPQRLPATGLDPCCNAILDRGRQGDSQARDRARNSPSRVVVLLLVLLIVLRLDCAAFPTPDGNSHARGKVCIKGSCTTNNHRPQESTRVPGPTERPRNRPSAAPRAIKPLHDPLLYACVAENSSPGLALIQADINAIAKQFVEFYYNQFDSDVRSFFPLLACLPSQNTGSKAHRLFAHLCSARNWPLST